MPVNYFKKPIFEIINVSSGGWDGRLVPGVCSGTPLDWVGNWKKWAGTERVSNSINEPEKRENN